MRLAHSDLFPRVCRTKAGWSSTYLNHWLWPIVIGTPAIFFFAWWTEMIDTLHIKLRFNICLYRFSWHVTQSGVSQKHANFRTFSSFSCISFELLSFFPSVYKTNVHKLSVPLHLKAIIKIFRSGFWDLRFAIQTCRGRVHATCKQYGAITLKRMPKTGHYHETRRKQ